MSAKTIRNSMKQDAEFNMAFGWLSAMAISIASWANLA